jgi:hypothetical protein
MVGDWIIVDEMPAPATHSDAQSAFTEVKSGGDHKVLVW